MSSTESARPSRIAGIVEQYEKFVSTDITTLEQFQISQRRSEEIAARLQPLQKEEKGLRTALKRMTGQAANLRGQINELTAEKQEHDYLIRETLRSPNSPLKAYFLDERRGMPGRAN